jgi:hypothetical protein
MPSESCFMFANERELPFLNVMGVIGSHISNRSRGSATDDKQHRAERKYLIRFVVIRKQCKGTIGKTKSLETHCNCPQTNGLAQPIARHRWKNRPWLHACIEGIELMFCRDQLEHSFRPFDNLRSVYF